MPTPEAIAKARSLLSSGNVDEATKVKLRAVVGDDEVESGPPEPEADGGGHSHVTELDPVKIEGTVPEKSWFDGFKETAEDAAHGFADGVYLDHADDLGGLMFGDEGKQRWRDQTAAAKERSPKAHFIASMLGGIGPGLIAAPLGAVTGGAVLGGAAGHGVSDDADAERTAANVLLGAGGGAMLGEGVDLAIPAARKFAGWAGGKAGDAIEAGQRWFGRALGMTDEQARSLQAEGKLSDYIKTWKEQGIGDGIPTQNGMRNQAVKAKNMADAEMGEVLDKVPDAVVEPTSVTNRMRAGKSRFAEGGEGQKYRGRIEDAATAVEKMERRPVRMPAAAKPTGEMAPPSNAPEWYAKDPAPPAGTSPDGKIRYDEPDPLTALADDFELGPYGKPETVPPGPLEPNTGWPWDDNLTPVSQRPPPMAAGAIPGDLDETARSRYGIPLPEARKELTVWGRDTNWESDTLGHEVKGDMYHSWRGAITDAIDAHAPGQGRVWRDANWNKHAARSAEEFAQQRAPQIELNVRSLMGTAARVGMAGRDRIIGSKLATGVAAPMARGAQRVAAGAANAADSVAGQAASNLMTGRGGGGAMRALAQDDSKEIAKRTQDQAHGHQSGAALLKLLQSNPQALGPFQSKVRAIAEKSPDPMKDGAAWSALLDTLEHDPVYRRQVKSAVDGLTNSQQ